MARVLVVDDNPDLLRLVEVQLKKDGHKVATASNGADALALVDAQGAPDIAVLDVSMPDMDGLEVLKRLRDLPGLEAMPAIFLSARVSPEDIAAGKALGARYLTKPYVAKDLLEAIKAAINTLPSGRLIQDAQTDEEVSKGW